MSNKTGTKPTNSEVVGDMGTEDNMGGPGCCSGVKVTTGLASAVIGVRVAGAVVGAGLTVTSAGVVAWVAGRVDRGNGARPGILPRLCHISPAARVKFVFQSTCISLPNCIVAAVQ